MVLQHHTALPAPSTTQQHRKFRPITKRANTFALDIRQYLSSTRTPYIVIILLSLPFLSAIVAVLTRPQRNQSATVSPSDAASAAARAASTVASQPPPPLPYSGPLNHLRPQMAAAGDPNAPVVAIPPQPVPTNATAYLAQLAGRRKAANLTARSVTLIASCQGMHNSLVMSFPSWAAQKGVDHIVLVDSSAQSSSEWHRIPNFSELIDSGRLTVVLSNSPKWALSRAYNLAAQFALSDYILKVDCDTFLHDDFVAKHELPTQPEYYTVAWGSPRDENEERLRGVWFGSRANFGRVGGYDERIVRYGFEDTDLYNRFNERASLTPKALNLDSLRHSIAPALVYHQVDDFLISRHISIRAHAALIKSLPAWPDVHTHVETTYSFAYDEASKMLLANVTREAPDPYLEKTSEDREVFLKPVLELGLHDDFHLPWDLLTSFPYQDLLFLARYLDHESEPHVIVALLEGEDSLTNMFNLVSVTQLGMTTGRPVIVIWKPPGGANVRNLTTPLLHELLDMEATNEQLTTAAKADAVTKVKVASALPEHVRVIAADAWKCVQGLAVCGAKYDGAYKRFTEVSLRMPHVYDETDSLPLSLARHVLLRLRARTKIGNDETRLLCYKALVQSARVREAQQVFAVDAKIGIVAEAAEAGAVAAVAAKVRARIGAVGMKQVIPVVGNGRKQLLKAVFGKSADVPCCRGASCSLQEIAGDVANVHAMSEAAEVFPGKEIGTDIKMWLQPSDDSYKMVHELWTMHRG